jgi:ElaB/YqjD/DUF883 family membrane-anchored ribosome-binding protein
MDTEPIGDGMSDVQQLKKQLERLSSDARSTASKLSSFKSMFSKSVNQVEQRIGGTATRKDKEIIETLQAAEKKVEEAAQTLQKAAKDASDYANKL